MNNSKELLWGIDLGGTKIEGVVLTPSKDPEILFRERIATEGDQGYEHVLQRIGVMVNMMKEAVNLQPPTLGIGTPGTLDPHTELLKNSNSTSLNGKPFKRDLEKVIDLPIVMANDANCFALAEARLGTVQDIAPRAKVVFGVIMGTGVGGGIVVDGKVINGQQGIGGEWGHIFLDESGGKCYCGKTGCVETIISGPALERFYHQTSGQKKKLKEIIQTCESDPAAKATAERLIRFFGKGVSYLINILDPEVIVLGGGVGNIDLLYTLGVEEAKQHIFNNRFDTRIVKPKLGDSAGVFGAALLMA